MKRVDGWTSASSSSCPHKGCVKWVEKYFKDCVCNLSSEISFGLGLISLACWGIAEIPQIVTNFHTKSGHGVSLALLLTWFIGDIFNLVGCLLEPATLPTQLYTALLYTSTTVVLLLQTIYYDYCLNWWKNRAFYATTEVEEDEEERKRPLNPKQEEDLTRPIPTAGASFGTSPNIYYTSARSMANSGSSPHRSSYLVPSGSGPSAGSAIRDSDSEKEEEEEAMATHRRVAATKPRRIISRSVGYGSFLASTVGLPFQARGSMEVHMGLYGVKLLQEAGMKELEENPYGLLLGWIMAAIYMGGRLPQIYLNIKRGNVEGLNPLMFLFALIANATYVGSILVRSVEWEKIKANAPWLLDAIVCVLLDLFILLQFAYYKFMHRRTTTVHEEECEGYEEAKKPLV